MSEPELQLPDRLAGAVWGHLVGDAVGVPYEFRQASEIGEVRFGATGSHHQPPGTWSDDGALMLAVLDSLLTVGLDLDDQGRRAVDWYRHGAYTPDGQVFDIGNATRSAIEAIEAGTPAATAGGTGEYSSGNGSLMRILPIALVCRDDDAAQLVEHARSASRVTHGTAQAQVACALYVIVARRLLAGRGGRAATLMGAQATLRTILAAGPDAATMIAALDHLDDYAERGGRGRVWDSFWSAWDAFAGADSYRNTIERAVAYGEDTDTTAAIAGGLAGIRWGVGGIPSNWLAGMRGRDLVRGLVNRLVATDGWRTSTLKPLRMDWLDLAAVPGLAGASGRLGMTILPGKHQPAGIGGNHWRDLELDARHMREADGIDAFLLLVEDWELPTFGVPDFLEVMAANGIEILRLPIVDDNVPTDVPAFRATLADLRRRIEAGQRVGISCRGGLGRTGTTVACLLIDAGLDPEAAIALTRGARHGTIETAIQERFVRSWTAGSRPEAGR